jgi:hypothetical protein
MKKAIYVLLFTVLGSSVIAQDGVTSFQYSVGIPSGDLHGYIKPATFRGVSFQYMNMVKANMGAGIEIGWNLFYEKLPFDSYTYRNVTYSAKQYRYSSQVPIFVTATYLASPDKDFSPFAGFGVGTLYTGRKTDMGSYSFTQDAWQFGLRPEIGILYSLASGPSVTLSTKYYYGFKGGNLPSQNYFTINFGMVFN